MSMEKLKLKLIGTPLQPVAERLRWWSQWMKRAKHPELNEIYLEGKRGRLCMHKAISDGMNCIDIGCHLGSVIQEIMDLSPSGKHIAVEPIPYKAEWLRGKYPELELHEVALSDETGETEFFVNPKKSGFSGLKKHHADDDVQRIQVAIRRLDDLVPAELKIGFMKVDVEGAELGVFRGAKRILTEDRPVMLFECTKSGLESFGYSASDIYKCLDDEMNYDIYLFTDYLEGGEALTEEEFVGSQDYPFKAFNYMGVSRG